MIDINNNDDNKRGREWILIADAIRIAESKSRTSKAKIAELEANAAKSKDLIQLVLLKSVAENCDHFLSVLKPFAERYGKLNWGDIARLGDQLIDEPIDGSKPSDGDLV